MALCVRGPKQKKLKQKSYERTDGRITQHITTHTWPSDRKLSRVCPALLETHITDKQL